MQYEIIRSDRKTLSLQIKPDGRIIARAPKRMKQADIESFINSKSAWLEKHLSRLKASQGAGEKLSAAEIAALKQKAKIYIPKRVQYYSEIIGVDYGKITIRCQKTRWGSCTAKGNLNFNCLLMLTPPEVIDSVIVHELCHRKEMNHSKRFYAAVLKACPEYKKWNSWLKTNGNAIMARVD